jgi:regulator of sigma E protease
MIAILGVLITAHELGHLWGAKIAGIRVHEFAVGMGPAIWSRVKGETRYTLRALPIGGYCALAETAEADPGDKRAFPNRPLWARALVLFSGSFMNFALGLLLAVIFFSQQQFQLSTTIAGLSEGFPHAELQAGDKILSINGAPVYLNRNITMLLDRNPPGPHDITVLRDGQRVVIRDLPMVRRPYMTDGVVQNRYGIHFGLQEATFGGNLRDAFFNCIDLVRLVRMGLGDLIFGRASIDDVASPIALTGEVNNILQSETLTARDRSFSILMMVMFFTVNLAVINLMPIPGLDGGRLLFLLIEFIFRRPVPPRYEGWIHGGGMVLLFGFMAFVLSNDIMKLFR